MVRGRGDGAGRDVGAVGENVIAENLGEPWQIAIFFPLFAVFLYLADRRPQTRHLDDVGIRAAVGVGLAQSLSLMPGVSRPGSRSPRAGC